MINHHEEPKKRRKNRFNVEKRSTTKRKKKSICPQLEFQSKNRNASSHSVHVRYRFLCVPFLLGWIYSDNSARFSKWWNVSGWVMNLVLRFPHWLRIAAWKFSWDSSECQRSSKIMRRLNQCHVAVPSVSKLSSRLKAFLLEIKQP